MLLAGRVTAGAATGTVGGIHAIAGAVLVTETEGKLCFFLLSCLFKIERIVVLYLGIGTEMIVTVDTVMTAATVTVVAMADPGTAIMTAVTETAAHEAVIAITGIGTRPRKIVHIGLIHHTKLK